MPEYTYLAVNEEGRRISGTMAADNRRQLSQQLHARGLDPIEIRLPTRRKWFVWSQSISARELIFFTTRLGHMLGAGMSIGAALRHIQEHTSSAHLKTIAGDLNTRLREGIPLSDAMLAHPDVFSPLYRNIVRSGEASGSLDERLLELSDYLDEQAAFRREVKEKLAYPLFAGLIITAVFLFYAFYVFPKVLDFFGKVFKNIDLPWASHVLLFVSRNALWIGAGILAVLAGLVGAFLLSRISEKARHIWDAVLLRIPVLGSILVAAATARISHAFGTLLGAGLPLLEVIDLAAPMSENKTYEAAIRKTQERVIGGMSLGDAARAEGFPFPPMIIDMIASGEKSGRMRQVLEQSTEFFRSEVRYQFRRMLGILEPALLIFLGSFLVLIILGVFFPLYENIARILASPQ